MAEAKANRSGQDEEIIAAAAKEISVVAVFISRYVHFYSRGTPKNKKKTELSKVKKRNGP